MELNTLYDIAEKENIKIYNYNIDNVNGAFINYEGINAIAMNYKNIDTEAKEKSILAEELGHYYYDATYSPLCTNVTLINKQEYKAKKWAIKTLIPYSKLIKEYYKNLYELADEFGVTEELILFAYQYYVDNNYIRKEKSYE
jgi:Zn-dependent peptidase ImmA (M78 family)